MTGSTKDPENGPAVAGSVFAAVVVYAVRAIYLYSELRSSSLSLRLPACVITFVADTLEVFLLGIDGYRALC